MENHLWRIMIMDITTLVSQMPEPRRRNPHRIRGPYRKKQTWQRTDLIRHLVSCGIHTTGQLRKSHQPEHPTLYDYIKEFRSWKEATNAAFGPPLVFFSSLPPTRENLIRCSLEYNIRNRRAWIRARKIESSIPSIYWVMKVFGGFKRFIQMVDKVSLVKRMEAYVDLTLRLQKRPSLIQCRQNDIDIKPFIQNFETKQGLDTFVASLIRQIPA
jgi:hypothetical protein